jgi:hypothetical protein
MQQVTAKDVVAKDEGVHVQPTKYQTTFTLQIPRGEHERIRIAIIGFGAVLHRCCRGWAYFVRNRVGCTRNFKTWRDTLVCMGKVARNVEVAVLDACEGLRFGARRKSSPVAEILCTSPRFTFHDVEMFAPDAAVAPLVGALPVSWPRPVKSTRHVRETTEATPHTGPASHGRAQPVQ